MPSAGVNPDGEQYGPADTIRKYIDWLVSTPWLPVFTYDRGDADIGGVEGGRWDGGALYRDRPLPCTTCLSRVLFFNFM
ncbi:hypothetical protein J6590_105339 [Homalodisca vitripennis]|nr:hypothetical protein J6590_105339 [Homalodisca vitripennis]